jgi:hypothetical protein
MLKIFRSQRSAPTAPLNGGPSAAQSTDAPMDDEDLDEDEDLEGSDEDEEEETAEGEGDEDEEEEEAPAAPAAKDASAARIQAILTSDAGRANRGLAEALAFGTKLSAAKAEELLKASNPTAAPTGKRQGLADRLRNEGADRPRVNVGGRGGESRSEEDEQIAAIVGAAGRIGIAKRSA